MPPKKQNCANHNIKKEKDTNIIYKKAFEEQA